MSAIDKTDIEFRIVRWVQCPVGEKHILQVRFGYKDVWQNVPVVNLADLDFTDELDEQMRLSKDAVG